jgi:hypothetical protein
LSRQLKSRQPSRQLTAARKKRKIGKGKKGKPENLLNQQTLNCQTLNRTTIFIASHSSIEYNAPKSFCAGIAVQISASIIHRRFDNSENF